MRGPAQTGGLVHGARSRHRAKPHSGSHGGIRRRGQCAVLDDEEVRCGLTRTCDDLPSGHVPGGHASRQLFDAGMGQRLQQRYLQQPLDAHDEKYPRIQRPAGAVASISLVICIELSFTDDPARLAARPAHRQQLQELHARGVLLAAGPWDDDSGAILLLETDQAGARAVLEADPYFTTAGVKVMSIRDWRPVVGSVVGSS